MKLELNPHVVAGVIVAEVDKKGNGLSRQHEVQLTQFIIDKLSSFEVKAEKPKKEDK
jgi:hypothetical protein